MKDKRPINLDIGTIHLPLAAYASILHRISGVIVFIGIAVLLWLFDVSTASEEGFNGIRDSMASPLFRLILWGILAALAYHMIAGVRHLLMDIGIGESKQGGELSARLTLILGIIVVVITGALIW